MAMLQPLSDKHDIDPQHKARNVQFFALIKSLTADGCYTSKIGLMNELQFQGDQMLERYPECES